MKIQIISKSNQNVRNIIRAINTCPTGGARSSDPMPFYDHFRISQQPVSKTQEYPVVELCRLVTQFPVSLLFLWSNVENDEYID